jgi:hypothetical protein
MFNINNFKNYLSNNLTKEFKEKISLDELLNAMCDFTQSIYKSLNIPQSTAAVLLRKYFDTTGKPSRVPVSVFYLFKFGFKKCSTCKTIQPTINYTFRARYWNKLDDDCTDCKHLENTSEAKQERNKNWDLQNPDKVANRRIKRQIRIKTQTPDLSINEQQRMKEIYKLRDKLTKETGIEYHVDHIVPLSRGGLHHPDNLQVITAKENLKKGTKIIEGELR